MYVVKKPYFGAQIRAPKLHPPGKAISHFPNKASITLIKYDEPLNLETSFVIK